MKKKSPSVPRRPARFAEVGEVYGLQVPEGRFGACQVLARDGGRAELGVIEGTFPAMPDLASLAGARFVRRTLWPEGTPSAHRCNVDAVVPWWATCLGTSPLLESFDEPCGAFGGWSVAQGGYWAERFDVTGWSVDPTPVVIDVGGGAATLRRDQSRVTLGPEGDVPVPADGRIDFGALAALPRLHDVRYRGPDIGYPAFLRSSRVRAATVSAVGHARLDLAGPALDELTLYLGSEAVELEVGPRLTQLLVFGDPARLTVRGADVRHPFHLWICSDRVAGLPRGLEGAAHVTLSRVKQVDGAALAAHGALRELLIAGALGRLSGLGALARHPSLAKIELRELYEMDVSEMPEDAWPSLQSAVVHGIRSADAPALKASLARVPSVRVTGSRSDAWIHENAHNPFRDWEEDGAAFGKKACLAWKKAHQAVVAREGAAVPAKEAEAILEELVRALNALRRIDTLRREQAADAFFELATRLGLDDARAAERFDAWRDF